MKRPFKIAIAGTHSTGKSTFAARLMERISGMSLRAAVVHDSAQDARNLGFPILSEHTFESTSWLIGNAIRLEAEASLGADVIIVDRPVPDALGYLRAALSYTGRGLEDGRLERLERICETWVAEYDLFFVTKLEMSVPLGAGRDGNEQFRRAAAEAVCEVVERMVPRHLTLRHGQTAGAEDLALDSVRQYFKRDGA